MSSGSSPTKGFHFNLQPAPAWLAILGLVIFSTLGILLHAGSTLRLAFPVGAFSVGLFLYLRYPILYVGFTWWMWFLTPCVRRLIDYQSGWVDPSPVLLAPFLVTIITFITFLKYFPASQRHAGLPFVLAFTGVVYGFLVGVVKNPSITTGIALLNWLTPILFGFHLFVNWRDYPLHRHAIQRIFFWCVLVTGAYGVLQYLLAPEWDSFWLENIRMANIASGLPPSFGLPKPLEIRVFSTMHGPGVFAVVMMAGLLLLLTHKGGLYFPATIVGYLAFLLSSVRAAWGGWVIGFFTLFASLKSSFQIRLILTTVVVAMVFMPLITVEPFSDIINARIQTFFSLEEDGSGLERRENYERWLGPALTNFIGEGIGGTALLDSAVLDMLLSLGWFGTVFYMSGLLSLLFKLFHLKARLDPFASHSRAIALSIFFQLIFGSMMLGLPGLVLWSFLGLGLAAHNYHRQSTVEFK